MKAKTAFELIVAIVAATFMLAFLLTAPSFLGIDFHAAGMSIVVILIAYLAADLLAFRLARGGRGVFLSVISNRIMTESRAYVTYYVIIVILSLITGAASIYIGNMLNSATNAFENNLIVSLIFSIVVYVDLRLRYYRG